MKIEISTCRFQNIRKRYAAYECIARKLDSKHVDYFIFQYPHGGDYNHIGSPNYDPHVYICLEEWDRTLDDYFNFAFNVSLEYGKKAIKRIMYCSCGFYEAIINVILVNHGKTTWRAPKRFITKLVDKTQMGTFLPSDLNNIYVIKYMIMAKIGEMKKSKFWNSSEYILDYIISCKKNIWSNFRYLGDDIFKIHNWLSKKENDIVYQIRCERYFAENTPRDIYEKPYGII